ncbi:hypothetical protein [Aureliella helgolandensis]|uniref:Uncharacterized protein n=1 Tax=Aureliella helgolandensis TaxID=2527968 RepID=A0A518G6K6_9BACT|nr:hypothetical protein [Aureliella helgolandensis]QDV24204.1 hypothetical protein Q31a_25190 [Aureliella helgolandensis]
MNICDDFEIISIGPLIHVRVHDDSRQAAPLVYAQAIDRQVQESGRVCVLMELCLPAKRSAIPWWQTSSSGFRDPIKLDEVQQWLESGRQQEWEECNHGIS